MSTTPKLLGYMAWDQYGRTYHLTEPRHPRKQLLARLARRSARRQYTDTKAGGTKQTGWVIGGLWLTVYEVREFDGLKTTRVSNPA